MTDSHTMARPQRKAAAVATNLVTATLNSNNRTPSGARSTMGTIGQDENEKKKITSLAKGRRSSTSTSTTPTTPIDRGQNSANLKIVDTNDSPRVEITPKAAGAAGIGRTLRSGRSLNDSAQLTSRLRGDSTPQAFSPQVAASVSCANENNTFETAENREVTPDPVVAKASEVSETPNLLAVAREEPSESATEKNSFLDFAQSLIKTFKGGGAKSKASSSKKSEEAAIEENVSPNTDSQSVGIKTVAPQGRQLRSSSQSSGTLLTREPTSQGVDSESPISKAGGKANAFQPPSTRKSASQSANPQNLTPKIDNSQVQVAYQTTPQVIINSSPISSLSSSSISSLRSQTPSPPAFAQERETEVPLIKQVGQNQIAQKRKMDGILADLDRGREQARLKAREQKRKNREDQEERYSKKQKISEPEDLSGEIGKEAVTDDDATISDGPTPVKETTTQNARRVDNQVERRSSRERRPAVPRGASPVSRQGSAPPQKLPNVWTPLARSPSNTPIASPRIQAQPRSRVGVQSQRTGFAEGGNGPFRQPPALSHTTPQSQARSQYQLAYNPGRSAHQTPGISLQEVVQSELQNPPRPTFKPRSLARPSSQSRARSENTAQLPSELRKKALREQGEARNGMQNTARHSWIPEPEQNFDHFQIDRPPPQGPPPTAFQVPSQGQKRRRQEVDSKPNPAANNTRGSGQAPGKDTRNAVNTEARIQAEVRKTVTSANPRRYEDIASLQYINQEAQVQRPGDLVGLNHLVRPRPRDNASTAGARNTPQTGGPLNAQNSREEPAKKKIRYDSGDALGLFLASKPDVAPALPPPTRDALVKQAIRNSLTELEDKIFFILPGAKLLSQATAIPGTTWSLVGPLSIPGYSDIPPPPEEIEEPEPNTESNLNSAASKVLNSLREQFVNPTPPKAPRVNQSVIPDFSILGVGQLQRAGEYLQEEEFTMFTDKDKYPLDHPIHATGIEDCTFCSYTCDFGVADSRVLLPAEAFPGFCSQCNMEPMDFNFKWADSGKEKLFTEACRGKGSQLLIDLEKLPYIPFASAQADEDFIYASETFTGRKIFGSMEERKSNGGHVAQDVPKVLDVEHGQLEVTHWQAVQTCRGNPWGQVDCRKAHICGECLSEKLEIIKHRKHSKFSLITNDKNEAVVDPWGEAIFQDPREKRCMICPATVASKCDDCPLRVCVACESFLVHMGKGYLNNLFYFFGRRHLRNDAFLLRSDGGGY